ncbi:MAG: pantothenate kinase, partial [Pseudomonadota bacterium]
QLKTIATGGLSPLFARGASVIEAVDPDLTVRGLVQIHRYNTKERME